MNYIVFFVKNVGDIRIRTFDPKTGSPKKSAKNVQKYLKNYIKIETQFKREHRDEMGIKGHK